MRRRVPMRRGGSRSTGDPGRPPRQRIALDDRPLALTPSRDGKRLLVTLPYEACVIHLARAEVERSIPLPMARPHLFEGAEGVLWIGGPHLHRASLWSNRVTKVGARLGGLVNRVALLRPTLLCGAGTAGEVLWDTEIQDIVHRRRTPERTLAGLVAAPDGRALLADGTSTAWIVDPDHPEGHTRLRLRDTADHDAPNQAIVTLGTSLGGRCLMAAADGTVGWTHRALRLAGGRRPSPRVGDRHGVVRATGREYQQRPECEHSPHRAVLFGGSNPERSGRLSGPTARTATPRPRHR